MNWINKQFTLANLVLRFLSTDTGTGMGNDILISIIAVEREIEQRLAAEERRAAEMLDTLRRELEETATREGERLAASVGLTVAAARTKAQVRADAVVRRATIRAQQLEGLDDETLERCIWKHLPKIIREQNR